MASAIRLLSATWQRWRIVPVHLRWTAGFLASVALASLVFVLLYQRQQSHEWLLGGQEFSSRQLAEIETTLAKSKLNDYDIRAGRVRIPRRERHAYLAALSGVRSLPLHSDRPLQEALEQSSPFESNQQRGARLELAQERELANCIRRLEGIEDATVHLDEAVVGFGLQRRNQATAVVFIQPDSDTRLEAARIDSIRRLVAGARVSLSVDDVTVANLASGDSYSGNGQHQQDLHRTDGYALRKSDFEAQWSEKILNVLRFIPDVEVSTNVELHFAGDRPQGPSDSARGRDTLMPSSVSVSVGIPASYHHDIWTSRQNAAGKRSGQPENVAIQTIEQEIREQVTKAVSPLLPVPAVGLPTSTVVVSTFPDIAGKSTVFDWSQLLSMGNAVSMVTIALAAFCVFIALRGVASDLPKMPRKDDSDRQRGPPRSLPSGELKIVSKPSVDAAHDDGVHQRQEAENEILRKTFHDELTSIVQENPQAAAEILKRWVEKAG